MKQYTEEEIPESLRDPMAILERGEVKFRELAKRVRKGEKC